MKRRGVQRADARYSPMAGRGCAQSHRFYGALLGLSSLAIVCFDRTPCFTRYFLCCSRLRLAFWQAPACCACTCRVCASPCRRARAIRWGASFLRSPTGSCCPCAGCCRPWGGSIQPAWSPPFCLNWPSLACCGYWPVVQVACTRCRFWPGLVCCEWPSQG